MPSDLTNAIDAKVLFEDTTYLDLQADIAAGEVRQAIHVQAFGEILSRARRFSSLSQFRKALLSQAAIIDYCRKQSCTT
jgi:hypothetical protein